MREFRIGFDHPPNAEREKDNDQVKQMEWEKEALAVSIPDRSTLTSVESERVCNRHRETHPLTLLLGPVAALLVWFLVGGWLYFFGLPFR
jgi:hypothetical protein